MTSFRSEHIIKIILIAFVTLFSNSCKEENEYDKDATIRLDASTATYDENAANIRIGFTIDHIRNENLSLKASIKVNDTTTYQDLDFQITSEAILKQFTNKGYFQLSIIDDKQIDLDDQIEITLLDPMQNKVGLSDKLEERNFKLLIKNNDQIAPDKFQADLTWRRKDPKDLPTGANLNLYVQTDVVVTDGVVTSIGKTFTSSEESNIFETVNLFESNPDKEYYIVVFFNLTYLNDIISYTLTLNGFGFNQKNFRKQLYDTDLGAAIFYGPFYKSGNKILGAGRSSEKLNEYVVTKEQLKKLGFTRE